MKRKLVALWMMSILAVTSLVGCQDKEESNVEANDTVQETQEQNPERPQMPDMPEGMTPPDWQGMVQEQEPLDDLVAAYAYDEIFSDRDLRQVADISDAVYVTLANDHSKASGDGVLVEGNCITFTKEGVYVLSGKLADGQLVVDCEDDKVQLVLDSVSLSSDDAAALHVKSADKVFVTTMAGTENRLESTAPVGEEDDDDVLSAVFSKSDLTFNGEGALRIVSEESHGITGNDDVVITGSALTVSAKGEGIQANDMIGIAGGEIVIEKSDEGLESTVVAIHGGKTTIHANDDGINATDMNDVSENETEFGTDGVSSICIFGGEVTIDSDADGIDSNGEFYMGGGTLYVSGANASDNAALDYSGSAQITGGVVVATGMSQMASNFGTASTQVSVLVTLDEVTDEEVVVKNASGEVLVTFAPGKDYNSVVVSSPNLSVGDTITVEAGGMTKQVEITDTITGGMGGFGGSGGFGGPGGERPQMPEGMEFPEGEMPQMPEGMEFPEGERPQMPEGMEFPGGEWPEMPQNGK